MQSIRIDLELRQKMIAEIDRAMQILDNQITSDQCLEIRLIFEYLQEILTTIARD